MAKIDFNPVREGVVIDAATLNEPYDDLASLSIGQDNTKPNWATRAHFDQSPTQTKANQLFFYDNDTTTGFTTTSTSYVQVSIGGNDAEVIIGKVVNAGDLLRVQTSGIIGDVVVNNDGDGTAAEISYNHFGMRLVLFYNDGGATLSQTIAECGYSYSGRAQLTDDNTGASVPIWWRNFSFSGIWTNSSTGRTLERVELQVKACPNGGSGNVVDITRHNITAILVKE